MRMWRGAVLVVTGLYFLVPLYASLRFALTTPQGHFSMSAFTSIPSETGFMPALTLSLRLAAVTMVLTMALMVPTAIVVHLRFPRLRPLFDGITLLPIGIPPIVLILGVLQIAPFVLKSTPYLLSLEYVVLAMPFAYRSLDAGLRAIDLKTLVEASRSLGGGWIATVWRVIVPNLRAALLSATILSIALVLGEFTMASLDLYTTLPVWIAATSQKSAQVSTSVSFLSLMLTWVLLLVISSFDRRYYRRLAKVAEEA
ncbi:MAG TPA: ABC transporter permease subunit, partial [Acidimicrobiales bacterium]|nr:ABC transporter permease subunit [Acidimicrobiales bacterium]